MKKDIIIAAEGSEGVGTGLSQSVSQSVSHKLFLTSAANGYYLDSLTHSLRNQTDTVTQKHSLICLSTGVDTYHSWCQRQHKPIDLM